MVARIIAYDELTETRIHKAVKGGSRWNSYFMQPPYGTRLPQAFLVENTPHRMLRTHFHDVDQFQVIVSGGGTLGKHAVRLYTVHFARAHTPYGPITAGEEGIAWLTIRARRDAEGAQFLPEQREKLEQAVGRKPWQISEDPEFLDFDGEVALRALPGVRDDRGLAAYSLRMKPQATTQAPDPAATGGQYLVVLRGSLVREGKEQRPLTIGYIAPDEGGLALTAGAEGLDALVLNFPRHDAPTQGTARSGGHTTFPSPPGRGAGGEGGDATAGSSIVSHDARIVASPPATEVRTDHAFKTWRCTLCAFVYDEAKGMPEEGVPPGTRWEDVPETWTCPDCAAGKADFDMVEI